MAELGITESSESSEGASAPMRTVSLGDGSRSLPQDIIDFYLTHSPYAKSDNPDSVQSLALESLGWSGRSPLKRLTDWMASHFVYEDEIKLRYLAAKKVENTAKRQGLLSERILLDSQQALLTIKNQITVDESGDCQCSLKETYASCFFRHVRNSIAHGFYWCFDDEWVLFKDTAQEALKEDATLTACLLVKLDFLIGLINYIQAGYEASTELNAEAKKALAGSPYRIQISKELSVKAKEENTR